jgi:hypothetical protein
VNWQEALWAELDAMDNLEQIKTTATWIEEITHNISPALAQRRRVKVREVLAQDDWDATKLAETIGASTSAIRRLSEEGRANERRAA